MKRLGVLFAIILFISKSFAQNEEQTNDCKFDSLYLVSGKEEVISSRDIRANAKLSYKDNKIRIEIEVEDDKIILNGDPVKSDHVEIYFSLNDYDVYYLKFKNENTKFENDTKQNFVRYYNQMVRENEGRKLKRITSNEIERYRNPYGIVHYGIFPSKNKPVLYDLELYKNLFDYSHQFLDTSSKHIVYSYKLTENGYKIFTEFDLKALKFLKIPEHEELTFMIDIVDIDVANGKSTVLSTSNKRKWFSPSTFNTIKLKTPIRFNPTAFPDDYLNIANLDLEVTLGQNESWSLSHGNSISEYVPAYRIVSEDISVTRSFVYDNRYNKRKFEDNIFEYRSFGDNLERESWNGYSYVINGKSFQDLNGMLDTIFRFNNKVIFSLKESGPCHPYGWGAGGAELCTKTRFFNLASDTTFFMFDIVNDTYREYIHGPEPNYYLDNISEGYLFNYLKLFWEEAKNQIKAIYYSDHPFKSEEEVPKDFKKDQEHILPIDSYYTIKFDSLFKFEVTKFK